MITLQQINNLKQLDADYVIGGSNAVMWYIGHDIRKCNDIDIHLTNKDVTREEVEDIFNQPVDISYEQIPCQIYNDIRVMQLEYLIALKLERMSRKDIYDLYFLLNIKFNKKEAFPWSFE